MQNKDLNSKIKNAFDKAVPDVLESVLADLDSAGDVIIADAPAAPAKPKRISVITRAAGIAAALAIFAGSAFGLYTAHDRKTVMSTVSLDVNPAVQIRVNSGETVISVTAGNDDAERIIGTADFTGSSLDDTVSALVDAMVEQGYISEIANSILVSVDSRDHKKSVELKDRLTRDIEDLLRTGDFTGAVLGQTVDDPDLEELAEKYGITESKAQLILRIAASSDRYSLEELAALSINELSLIVDSDVTEIENVDHVGSPSDKAYIGADNAVSAALGHEEIAGLDIDTENVSANINMKDGVMVYEIDLNYSGCDFGFMINATDGTVMKFSREVEYSDQTSGSVPTDTSVTETTVTEQPPEPEPEPPVTIPAPVTTPPVTEPPVTTTAPPVTTTTEATTKPEPKLISGDDAIGIAVRHAMIDYADTESFQLAQSGNETVYKVRLTRLGFVYDYEINARTGSIFSYSKDINDDEYVPIDNGIRVDADPDTLNSVPYTYYSYFGYSLNCFDEFFNHTEKTTVMVFETKEEFDDQIAKFRATAIDSNYQVGETATDLIKDAALFDEKFFEENELYLLRIYDSDSKTHRVIDSIAMYDGVISIETTDVPNKITSLIPMYSFYLIAIDRDHIS